MRSFKNNIQMMIAMTVRGYYDEKVIRDIFKLKNLENNNFYRNVTSSISEQIEQQISCDPWQQTYLSFKGIFNPFQI